MRHFFYLACVLILLVLWLADAYAHIHDRADLDGWFETLHTDTGNPCCGSPKVDATQLEETEWKAAGDHYEVRIGGEWIKVPPATVVHTPNLSGRALVWPFWINGQPYVRCFMPGELT